jgi:hypothetical protein
VLDDVRPGHVHEAREEMVVLREVGMAEHVRGTSVFSASVFELTR